VLDVSSVTDSRRHSQEGQSLVLFAVLLPLILLIAVLSVDVGNWWVHKRRLQTQVDAAALAAGPHFLECFREDETFANDQIALEALRYAGDWRRDQSTLNLQVQEPTDVFVALNSSQYWQQSDGTNPALPAPGYGLDYTANGDDPSTPELESSLPCDSRFLDVKATDDRVRPLWGLIPGLRDDHVVPSPKTHARIEIDKVRGLKGMLPWAIPEIAPKAVAVLFVDEEAPATAPLVTSGKPLTHIDPPPTGFGEFSVWDTLGPQAIHIGDGEVQDDRARIGVVVLVSEKLNPELEGSLHSVCNQDPVNVKCYGYGTNPTPTSGMYFIHGHAGHAMLKNVRLENLTCGADNKSAPWFAQAGDCEVRMRAVIDFGVTGNPTGPPVNASVNNMSWAPCADDPDLGCWTSGTFLLPEAGTAQAGRQNFSINWQTNPPGGGPKPSGTFEGVAHPYVADKHSGPVEYIQVNAGPNPADSVGFGPNTFTVRVGLNRPLLQTPKLDPPILLRFKGGSLSQTVNCDTDNIVYEPPFKPGWDLNSMSKDAAEIAQGCVTQYNTNGPGPCPAAYDTTAELPPDTITPVPIPTCAEGRPGEATKMREGLEYRFESPCTPNNWPQTEADEYPEDDDPRYVILIITDYGAFDANNERVVKVRRFAGFYVTGWDSGPAGGGGEQTGDCRAPAGLPEGPPYNDPHPLGLPDNKDNGDVWGYFVSFVTTVQAEPSDDRCDFDELNVCVVGLVE
jgi:Putative Flp pilus-assembly TadE/G-like